MVGKFQPGQIDMLEEDDSSTINARLPDPQVSTASGSSSGSNAVQSGKLRLPALAEAKINQNAAIVQASLDVAIKAKDQPLALLLKSAINRINELLAPQFGDNAIQAAASQDNTPAATAARIVSLSTGFYDAFKAQHPGESAGDVLSKFMATIRSGFEQGASEAQGILQGMGVLGGDIASNIDKTLALVRQGYSDFEAAQLSSLSPAADVNVSTARNSAASVTSPAKVA
jgi:hypothetical protein